jgi:hypothetical protein
MKVRLIFDYIKKAAPYRNPLVQIVDVIRHKLKINTHPSDYYMFEFYRGDKSWEEKRRYVGRYGSYFWPYTSILLKDMILLTNKYIQKHLLCGFGLPTPELLANVGKDYEVQSLEDLRTRLQAWKYDIVLKPISSAGGTNVIALSWDNGHFFGYPGKRWAVDDIWKHINKHWDSGFLIERRVFNIGETAKMNPHCLNTFRIVMIRSLDGQWHIPVHLLKLGSGNMCVDNISRGGIMVFLDDRGIATQALGNHFTQNITHHPDSGMPIIGFQAEGFKEVLALAHEASRKFVMFGTIGWDIAFTPEGPMIIEGNTLWGGKYQKFFGPIITKELANNLEKQHPFSRYSRASIFPKFQKKSRWPWSQTRWWA